ncbi:MAG TPA: LamG-like jellyroll fold domain-containing protein [Stenomitos sp.]
MLRMIITFLLAALLTLGCRPSPMTPVAPATVQGSPVLRGELVLPAAYQTQASSGQVKANATVTLIDPVTFQAKGTGITASDGTFTVQALGTFTPTLGTLYLLESTKTLGGTSSALFRLRTLVQLTSTGWTSVSGTTIQLSTATTAVAILWDQHGLGAADVIAKVTYDAVTRTHRLTGLNATVDEAKAREVEGLVQEALNRDLDPIQVVRPGPNGSFRLTLDSTNRNMLINSGFEEGGAAVRGWRFYNPVGAGTFSIETGIVYEGSRSIKITANGAGDMWYGQGTFWDPSEESPVNQVTGRTYTMSVYARGAVGGEKMTIAGSPVTLTTSWQRYSYTWTAPNNYRLVILRPGSVAGQATFPETVYVDAVQVEEGGTTAYQPRGTLLVDGFANAREAVGVTPADGRSGEGIFVNQGTNLLANSSFETDSNADGVPDSFVAVGGTVVTSLDASTPYFGARSLKFTNAAPNPGYVYENLANTFKAGSTYTFSVWVKGQNVSGGPSNNDFGIYIDAVKVKDGLFETTTVAAPTGTFDWTRISVTYTFLNDCSSAHIIPIFRNKTGTAWFDGFQVEQGWRATPYGGDGNGGTLDTLSFDANKSLNAYQGTLSFWYRPAYGWEESTNQIMAITSGSVDQDICDVSNLPGPNGQPQLRFHVHDGTTWHTGAVWQPTTAPWTAGSWHHLAITWGPRGVELYFDGSKVASDPYTGALYGGKLLRRLLFSGNYNNFSAAANGTLDGLKIWDVQQSPTWVSREYMGAWR